jgi:hypothetical protein
MQDEQEARRLASEFSDKSRRVKRTGGRFLVPLKFDEKGEALTQETLDVRKHLKSLSLTELRFLSAWRASGWDTPKAAAQVNITDEYAKRIAKKVVCFKDEEERIKALADVPTPDFIKAKHTENVFDGKLDESQRDSLKELAKIVGVYKQTNVSLTQNVFNLPPLTPEQETKLKEVYDAIATDATENAA